MRPLDLLYIPLALVTAPWWATKKRAGWRERLGWQPPAKLAGTRKRVLLHAVSVGEVSALRSLVPLLTPHVDVIVSTTTDTGLARAHDLYGKHDPAHPNCAKVVRFPLDFSWGVEKFLDAINPSTVALVELEVWPNFVRECSERHIPICIINGRLSERSFRGYRKIRRPFGKWLRMLNWVGSQDSTYARRFIDLGCDPSRVLLTGSMKWDSATITTQVDGAEELAREMGIDRSRPLVVAGSTAEDEEALLHASVPAGVQLLCAPRKPERFAEAAGAMPGCGRRSQRVAKAGDRFLLDTIGELRKAYALADVVVMGRSFGTLYGSDPVEPIAVGKATVIGPAYRDFQVMVDALVAGGGLVVTDRGGLAATLARLLGDGDVREGRARQGQRVIVAQQGASERYAELLLHEAGVGGTPQSGKGNDEGVVRRVEGATMPAPTTPQG
jgi:3-deoxy-D-manno-octulosonic-acid transferase